MPARGRRHPMQARCHAARTRGRREPTGSGSGGIRGDRLHGPGLQAARPRPPAVDADAAPSHVDADRGASEALKILAIHEAGHAIAAIRLRLSLRYTMLEARWPHNGSTVFASSPKGTPGREEREAVLAYAGCAAELQALGNVGDWAVVFRSLDDFDKARTIGRRLVTEGELRPWIDDRRKDARALIAADWLAVQAVADAILERRKLYGPEVRELIR